MEALSYILIISLVLVMFGLLAFIVWNTLEHRKQVDELTSKLVARSYGEYVAGKNTKVVTPEKKKDEKVIVDSVMGVAGRNW